MSRINVYLPNELAETLRERLPGLNVSGLVQDAIRALLACDHRELACRDCAQPLDRWGLIHEHLARFYSDAMWEISALVARVGTAEGAARVLREVASRHQIPNVGDIPVPRPSRAAREAAKVRDLPIEADSRRRHPTTRAASPVEQATEPEEDIA